MRVGIIGYGNIAKVHAEVLKNNPNFDLVAVLDEQDKRGGLDSRIEFYFPDRLQEFFDRVEVVVICTPPYLHSRQAIQALRAGKHVLVEKPIATRLEEAIEMGKVAKKAGKVLMPSAHFSYNPRIRRMITSKENYGRITSIKAETLSNIFRYTTAPWIFSKKQGGGGTIMDDGVNVFDWLTKVVDGIKIRRVRTKSSDGRGGKKEVETEADIDFGFEDGKGKISLSFIHKGEETIRAILETGKGRIVVNYLDPKYQGDYRVPEYTAVYREFARRIRTRKIFDKRELESLRLVEDCYKLAKRQ